MSKHTPAPWTVSELDARGEVSEYYIFIEPGVAVIERKVETRNEGRDMANARLIAAAPAMLEALELADAMLSGANMNAKVVERKVRGALSAARGEA